jgi:hypothetical protein
MFDKLTGSHFEQRELARTRRDHGRQATDLSEVCHFMNRTNKSVVRRPASPSMDWRSRGSKAH